MIKILLFIQSLNSRLVDSSQTMVSVNLKDEYSWIDEMWFHILLEVS